MASQLNPGQLLITNYAARIRALDDDALERFVKDWVTRRTRDYVETQRWSGTGDMGRDVVGYVTHQRHEGDWDNFQCKQLSTRLSEREAFVELGKIFMHSAARQYRLPREYTFVAPGASSETSKIMSPNPNASAKRSSIDGTNSSRRG